MPYHREACGCQAKKSSSGGDFALAKATKQYHQDHPLLPEHIEINMNLDFANRTVVNSVINTLVSTQNDARTVVLDGVAFENVAVSDPDGRPLTQWRYDGEKIHVTWAEAVPRGEKRRVKVDYTVSNPLTGLMISVPDAQYPNRPTFMATDHETERARFWLACVDQPSVRTTLEYKMRGPAGYFAAANGLLQAPETINADGTKLSHWRLDYPCPSYLACFIFGDYEVAEDKTTDGMEVRYVGVKGTPKEDLLRTFKETTGMLTWLANKVQNKFPFPKYYQFIVPFIGGAMENISLVSWDELFLTDRQYASEFQHYTDIVNIHEMTHSYFGDAVVMRHFEHAWLKESWATYMEVEWLRDVRGVDEGRWELYLEASSYFQECEDYMRPIVTKHYDHSWSMFDGHLYPGGSCRLHMLRCLMGDEPFWAGVADYIAKFSKKTAETDDFRKCLEGQTGLNLTPFFDEWLYRPGYPKIKGTFEHNAETKEVTLTLEQTQVDQKRGIEVFTMSVEVEVRDKDGKVHTCLARFNPAGRAATVLRGVAAVDTVRIDPEGKLLFALDFNPGQDILKSTLKHVHGGDIVSRIRAAQELVKIGTRPCIAAVAEAMKTEPWFGVRVEAARALAKSKSEASLAAFAEILVTEQAPRALYCMTAAAGVRDERVRAALRTIIQRPAEAVGYMARARALESLAAQQNPADYETILQWTSDNGYQHIVRAGALKALGITREPKAFDYLLSRLPYGLEPERIRNRLVDGVAECAKWQDKVGKARAVEAAVELLRDPQVRVRMAAKSALVTLEAASAAGAVEAMKCVVPPQEHPSVDRAVLALRSAGPSTGTAGLQKQVEELYEKVKKLETQLQDTQAKLEPPSTK